MKTLFTIAFFNCIIYASSITAQTPSTNLLYGALMLDLGPTTLEKYTAQNLYTSDIYLHRGNSVNLSFSMGGNHFGFNMLYFNSRYSLDFDKTIKEDQIISALKISGSDFNRLSFAGFVLGPYGSVGLGRKERFRVTVIPAVGLASSRLPALSFNYENGGFSVISPETTNRLTYAVSIQASFSFWKQLAVGVIIRSMSFNTSETNKLVSTNYGISLSYRFPL